MNENKNPARREGTPPPGSTPGPGSHRCGRKCEVWIRGVGFFRPVDAWNPGKQAEFRDRKTYKIGGL